jgi:hypothetical protein
MMTVIVLLLAMAPDGAAAPPAIENEITVIGKRLRDWRAVIRVKNGVPKCSIKRSTGDAAIDAIGCDAMLSCLPRFAPEFRAIPSDLDRATRDRRSAEISQRMAACVEARNDVLIAALVAQRRGLPDDDTDPAA